MCTSNWSITWPGCGSGGYRRHLQTTRKRPSLGYILCSMSLSLSKVGSTAGFLGHSFGAGFGSPFWRYSPFLSMFFCSSYFLPVGIATHYYSWRFMQLILGLVGLLVFFLILFFLPETYHPNQRGVDKLDPSLLSKWRPVILNPLQPLLLLRSPNLLFVVRILLSFCYFEVWIWTSLWLALRFCSPTLVCDFGFVALYIAYVSSINGTTCIYNCKFAQRNVPLSLSWRQS